MMQTVGKRVSMVEQMLFVRCIIDECQWSVSQMLPYSVVKTRLQLGLISVSSPRKMVES